MVREPIEVCPEAMWTEGEPRSFWRVAYHALYFGEFYLMAGEADFHPWPKHRDGAQAIWEVHPELTPYTREELLEYWARVDGLVDTQIEILDIDAETSGFPWYPMPKLDHLIVNIRHIQEHAGQLRDRLLTAGLDPRWVGQVRAAQP